MFGLNQGQDVNNFKVKHLNILVLQDKITKEVSFILANQETIRSQITQLEAVIKQMEVVSKLDLFSSLFLYRDNMFVLDSAIRNICLRLV